MVIDDASDTVLRCTIESDGHARRACASCGSTRTRADGRPDRPATVTTTRALQETAPFDDQDRDIGHIRARGRGISFAGEYNTKSAGCYGIRVASSYSNGPPESQASSSARLSDGRKERERHITSAAQCIARYLTLFVIRHFQKSY